MPYIEPIAKKNDTVFTYRLTADLLSEIRKRAAENDQDISYMISRYVRIGIAYDDAATVPTVCAPYDPQDGVTK